MRVIRRDEIMGPMMVPPECQGQTIEVSYGWIADGTSTIVRRCLDRSDGTETWAVADGGGLSEDYHPVNGAPEIADDAWVIVAVGVAFPAGRMRTINAEDDSMGTAEASAWEAGDRVEYPADPTHAGAAFARIRELLARRGLALRDDGASYVVVRS